ncbi:hypothetical protein GC163_13475 [bacterium]|nr:hypothetical protein [bacterium]
MTLLNSTVPGTAFQGVHQETPHEYVSHTHKNQRMSQSPQAMGEWKESVLETMFDHLILVEPQLCIGELLTSQLRRQIPQIDICHSKSLQETVRCLSDAPASLVVAEVRFAEGGISRLSDVIQRIYPRSHLVAWTQHHSEYLTAQASELGLYGVLPKSMPLNDLVASLELLLRGGKLSPVIPSLQAGGTDSEVDLEAIRQLTGRQIEIMLLLSEGYSVKQVAQKLHLTVKSVDSLKYRLMKQLGFNDRVQLTRFAIRAGLIDP